MRSLKAPIKLIMQTWVLALLVLVSFWYLIRKSYLLYTPPHNCVITSLLVDPWPFPPGTVAAPSLSPIPGGPLSVGTYDDAMRAFAVGSDLALHEMYQARTERRAIYEYRAKKEGQFRTARNRGPWQVPSEFSYHSPVASDYDLRCGNIRRSYTCIMVARYEEYYTVFEVGMSGMTFQDLEHVLLAIDEKMASCLRKPLPSPS